MSNRIRILLADNQVLIREGIKSVCSDYRDLEIVGEACNGDILLQQIATLLPDLIIIDYDLPGFFCLNDIARIFHAYPEAKVLVVTANQEKTSILKALEYGVNSYILKLCDEQEFVAAIYATVKREKFLCGKVIDAILEHHLPKKGYCEPIQLSLREIEIVQLISEGLTNNEIATKLFLSVHTVSTHRKNILKKLDLRKTSELMVYALTKGILAPVEA